MARQASPPVANLPTQTDSSPSGSGGLAAIDPGKEKAALKVLLNLVRKEIVSAAEAMPADKYGFVPVAGAFNGVRSFGRQVKHLAATNHILAAAALGEAHPLDAGDEMGPETVTTKDQILTYLKASFAHLDKALEAAGTGVRPQPSPISPLQESQVTGSALVVEALIHSFDHYGQMVEYLRMNGVIPPASVP